MKIVNDTIYGPIELSPASWAFIDTPAFQRLRNITQLGMVPWVYPTGCHKRFEHCLGTAYLAGKLVKQLRQSQSELGIDDKDIVCAELAGLLHDIGKSSGLCTEFWRNGKRFIQCLFFSLQVMDLFLTAGMQIFFPLWVFIIQ